MHSRHNRVSEFSSHKDNTKKPHSLHGQSLIGQVNRINYPPASAAATEPGTQSSDWSTSSVKQRRIYSSKAAIISLYPSIIFHLQPVHVPHYLGLARAGARAEKQGLKKPFALINISKCDSDPFVSASQPLALPLYHCLSLSRYLSLSLSLYLSVSTFVSQTEIVRGRETDWEIQIQIQREKGRLSIPVCLDRSLLPSEAIPLSMPLSLRQK